MIYSMINLTLHKRELIVGDWLSTLPHRLQLIHIVSVKGGQNGLLEVVRYFATGLL